MEKSACVSDTHTTRYIWSFVRRVCPTSGPFVGWSPIDLPESPPPCSQPELLPSFVTSLSLLEVEFAECQGGGSGEEEYVGAQDGGRPAFHAVLVAPEAQALGRQGPGGISTSCALVPSLCDTGPGLI